MRYDQLKEEVAPNEKAIDDWLHKLLVNVLAPMKIGIASCLYCITRSTDLYAQTYLKKFHDHTSQ